MRLYPQVVLWTYGILPTISLFILPHFLLTLAKAQQLRAKLISNALQNKIRAASALSKNQFRRYVPYNIHTRQIRDLTMNIPMNNPDQHLFDPHLQTISQMTENQPEMQMQMPTFQRSSDALQFQHKFDFTNSDTDEHQLVDQSMRMNSQPQHWGQQQESLDALQNMWNMNSFGAHSNSGVLRNGDDSTDMGNFETKAANPEPTKKKKKKGPKYDHEYYPNYYGNYGPPYPYYGRDSELMNEQNTMMGPLREEQMSQLGEMPVELQARAKHIQAGNPTNAKTDETVGCNLDKEDEEEEKKFYSPYTNYEPTINKLEDMNEKLKEDAKKLFVLPTGDEDFYQSGYGAKNRWNENLEDIKLRSAPGEKSAEPHVHSKGFSHTHTFTHAHRVNDQFEDPPNEYTPVHKNPGFEHSITHNSHASGADFNAGGVGSFGQNGAHVTAQTGLLHPAGQGYDGRFGQTNSHTNTNLHLSSYNHNIAPNMAPNRHNTCVSSLAGSQGGIIPGHGNTLVYNQIVGDPQQSHDLDLQFNQGGTNEFFNRETEMFSHVGIPIKFNTKRKTVNLNEAKNPKESINKDGKYSVSSEESKEKSDEDSKELLKEDISKNVKNKFGEKHCFKHCGPKVASTTLNPKQVTQYTTIIDIPSTEHAVEIITQASTNTPIAQDSTTVQMLGMMNTDEMTTTPFYILHPTSMHNDKEKDESLDNLNTHTPHIKEFTDNVLTAMTDIKFSTPLITTTPINSKVESLEESTINPNIKDLTDNTLIGMNHKDFNTISPDVLSNTEETIENQSALDLNQLDEVLEKNKHKLNLDDVVGKASTDHIKNTEDIEDLIHKDWSTLTDEEVEEIQFYKPEDEGSIVGAPLNKYPEPENVNENMVEATQSPENKGTSPLVQKRGPFESLEDKLSELNDEEKEEFMKQEFELISEVINEALRKRKLKINAKETLNNKEAANEENSDVDVASPNLINVRENFNEYRREAEDWNDMPTYDSISGNKRAVPIIMNTGKNPIDGQAAISDFRKKREVNNEYYVPLEDLVANPNVKLNIPTTLDNLGSVAKYTFESVKSPIYHAKNIAGNTKNILMSAARIPPSNLFIPSKYEIMKAPDNSEIVSAINQHMLDSRSAINAHDLPNEVTYTTDKHGLIDAFTKLRDLIRVGVNSGRDTVRHAYDISTDVRNLIKTTKGVVPNTVAHTPFLTKISPTVHQPIILTTPRILDWSKNIPDESSHSPSFVGIGNFLDSIGVSYPNQPKVPLRKVIVKPSETILKSQQFDSKTVHKPKTMETWIQEPFKVVHNIVGNEQVNSSYIKAIKDFLHQRQIYRESQDIKEAIKKRQITPVENSENFQSREEGAIFNSMVSNYNKNLGVNLPAELMKRFLSHAYLNDQRNNDYTDIFIEPEHNSNYGIIHGNGNINKNTDNQQNIRTSIIFNENYKKPFMGLATRKQIQAFLNEYNPQTLDNYENYLSSI